MKKTYETPVAEKIEFNYSEVVADSREIDQYYKSSGNCSCGTKN